jgi:5-methylcytosine-specific restriction endonuclease McrA
MSYLLSAPVLVLNANYEPLNVCTTKRAIGMMFSEKATMLENGRGFIRSVNQNFPAPSVIRLGRMIKRPRPAVKLTKSEVFRRDQYTCQYCGQKTVELTIDHIIPRSKEGSHTWNNLITACPKCNLSKGGRTAKEANMKLLSVPKIPKASAGYLFGKYLNKNETWLPYIEGW